MDGLKCIGNRMMGMKKEDISISTVVPDAWSGLRAFTAARIALGRTGVAVPLQEALAFKLAHAHARDAVHSMLDEAGLVAGLKDLGLPVLTLRSKAGSRAEYLQRPDLGRVLSEEAVRELEAYGQPVCDVSIVLGDGLSATAVNQHAVALVAGLLRLVRGAGWTMAPVTVVNQARVGISDVVGSLLRARVVLILIGERPGLSSADSLGAYLTYGPAVGLTDESRNCVSNIRPGGLVPEMAVQRIFFLLREALRLGISGVGLKDDSSSSLLL